MTTVSLLRKFLAKGLFIIEADYKYQSEKQLKDGLKRLGLKACNTSADGAHIVQNQKEGLGSVETTTIRGRGWSTPEPEVEQWRKDHPAGVSTIQDYSCESQLVKTLRFTDEGFLITHRSTVYPVRYGLLQSSIYCVSDLTLYPRPGSLESCRTKFT